MASRPLLLGPDAQDHWMMVEGGRITRRGTGTPPVVEGARSLDCEGAAIGPGLVNAHTHLYSGLASLGMPQPEEKPGSFLEILQRIWWRLDRALDARSLRVAARHYVADALLFGTTTLIDHHESPEFIEGSLDVLADACQELGMRAVVCYGVTERNGGREEARRGLAECRRFITSNDRPLVTGVVGLHAGFTVSDETIREAGELCRELGVVLHVHVAEDRLDVDDAQRRGYPGPLERLADLGALVPGSILAHGVHLEPAQVRMVEERGCWLVQNPRSNRKNGVGYARALGDSPRVALGTDGYPSDMQAEAVALVEAGIDDPGVRRVAGCQLVRSMLGDAEELREAVLADIACRRGARILCVVVDGRVVVEDGRLVTGDVEAILAEAREEAPRLWKRMGAL